MNYPQTAGYKASGPSQEAAENTPAETLRDEVMEALRRHGPMTSDEIANKIDRSILAVRPRCSELYRLGKVTDTGMRRKNESGHTATVWKENSKLEQQSLL